MLALRCLYNSASFITLYIKLINLARDKYFNVEFSNNYIIAV